MIRIIKGTYGKREGKGRIVLVTPKDGPFSLTEDQEKRLVSLGVAQFVKEETVEEPEETAEETVEEPEETAEETVEEPEETAEETMEEIAEETVEETMEESGTKENSKAKKGKKTSKAVATSQQAEGLPTENPEE